MNRGPLARTAPVPAAQPSGGATGPLHRAGPLHPAGLYPRGARLRPAYTQPLDQQDGSPLLHPPSPFTRERKPGKLLAEGLSMSPASASEHRAPGPPAGAAPAEAPAGEFHHRPVMVAEALEIFSTPHDGIVVDATVGGGGHSALLLASFPGLGVVGLDRDQDALVAARRTLGPYGERAVLVHRRFDQLGEVLDELAAAGRLGGPVVGVLFDLGVSSPQFDRPERGFSYRFDAPLDMRMDRSEGETAADVVNSRPPEVLARLFAEHGEARFARRIAASVAGARPVTTTAQLAEAVATAVPAAVRRRGHPAKRVFQALRAEVNSELEALPRALDVALARVVPGGHVAVISYHSGEDRIVKDRFVTASTGGCTCPPGLPCACGATPTARLLNRGARKPTPEEVASNPRSESARFRAVEILSVQPASMRPADARPERTRGGAGRGDGPTAAAPGDTRRPRPDRNEERGR
jgi:16S rRNA (cytosine1402-N4)-methyltransferase